MTPAHKTPTVSIIIPAYDEEMTIASVIRTAERHPLVDEVIVVSDGSSDGTASIARRTSATVIAFRNNRGKGSAMAAGVQRAKGDILVFLDADLRGLTSAMLTSLIKPVLSGRYDMFCLLRDRQSEPLRFLAQTIVLSGERALTRELWSLVPPADRTGFDVEIALNYYAALHGKRAGASLMPGLKQTIKERKHGLARGFAERLGMVGTCTVAYVRLYFFGKATMNQASVGHA